MSANYQAEDSISSHAILDNACPQLKIKTVL